MGYGCGLHFRACGIEVELDRVLVRGDKMSLMSGQPLNAGLQQGYKFKMQDLERMVRALVLIRGNKRVLMGYVGQENRDVNSAG